MSVSFSDEEIKNLCDQALKVAIADKLKSVTVGSSSSPSASSLSGMISASLKGMQPEINVALRKAILKGVESEYFVESLSKQVVDACAQTFTLAFTAVMKQQAKHFSDDGTFMEEIVKVVSERVNGAVPPAKTVKPVALKKVK